MGGIIVPGQTHRSLLSHALVNIVSNYTAESLKNTYRFARTLPNLGAGVHLRSLPNLMLTGDLVASC